MVVGQLEVGKVGSSYRDLLQGIRSLFPSPVIDHNRDRYFAEHLAQAVNKINALKSKNPILGSYVPPSYDQAIQATVDEVGMTMDEVANELLSYCQGLVIPGHPQTQRNVVSPATMSSLVAVLFSSLHDANLCWDEYSQRIALAEVEVAAMSSDLIGYDPSSSGGLFTFGGVGTNLYGIKVALEKAMPQTIRRGLTGEKAVVITSDTSHYCRYIVSGWLGIGADNLVIIPTDNSSAMRMDIFRQRLREVLQDGIKVAGILATAGTTDAFGIDDIAEIVAIRDRLASEFKLPYKIHVHVDAVTGWAWSVFNDYDFVANPLAFPPQTIYMLTRIRNHICKLSLADSIGIDFHKSGFAPYISSMVLFKNRKDLQLLFRPQEQAPCLFQFGEYRPGMFTLEGSRAGGGVFAALANLKLLGKQGYQVILAHLMEMSQLLREKLEDGGHTSILNKNNYGPVALFRLYPKGIDALKLQLAERHDIAYRDSLQLHNEYNRKVFEHLHRQAMAGHGAILSLVDNYQPSDYGEPMLALKSFVMSPFTDAQAVDAVVSKINDVQQTMSR